MGDEQTAKSEFQSHKPSGRNKYAIACAILASMTSVLLGYDGGVMTGAVIFIKDELKINDVQVEALMGTLSLYCLVGASVAGRTSDWIGRRYTIVFAGVFFFAGAILMGLAQSYALLMLGRFVAGIGVGYALMIAPVYTAEVSPASARGFLNTFPEVFINAGVLLGFVSNYAFSKLPPWLGWRVMLGIGAFPSVFIAVSVLAMPESPRWLVMKGRLGEARRVLDKTSDSLDEARLRLAEIKQAAGIPKECNDDVVVVPAAKKSHGGGAWRELLIRPRPAVRHAFIAGIGILFLQQTSGIDAVLSYGPRIFEKAGMKTSNGKLLATVGFGLSKTLFILVSTFLLDKIGRRPLLLASTAGMMFFLCCLGAVLRVVEQHPGQTLKWAPALTIAIVVSFAGSFSMGLGPIAWVYSSEVFPLRLRALGAGMGVAANRLASGLLALTFISMYKAITMSGLMFLYAASAAVSWLFFYVVLPETRNRSLEDMEVLFGNVLWKFSNKKDKTLDHRHGSDHIQSPITNP